MADGKDNEQHEPGDGASEDETPSAPESGAADSKTDAAPSHEALEAEPREALAGACEFETGGAAIEFDPAVLRIGADRETRFAPGEIPVAAGLEFVARERMTGQADVRVDGAGKIAPFTVRKFERQSRDGAAQARLQRALLAAQRRQRHDTVVDAGLDDEIRQRSVDDVLEQRAFVIAQ